MRKKLSKTQKEHVTKFLYDNHKLHKIVNMSSMTDYSNFSLCVDTKKELILFKKKLKNISLTKYSKFEKLIKIIYE